MDVSTNVNEKVFRFISLIKKDFHLHAVYLFGSTVKGKSNPLSDIDLAIVSQDFTGDSFDDTKLLIPYILNIDSGIEVHPFRPEDFTKENPFVQEILSTGLRII
ncbi:MAG: nucleotidyltransferase domain-containing protein [bacterium]